MWASLFLQVELLSIAGAVTLPPDFREQVQVELLRLASLRQELTETPAASGATSGKKGFS